MSGTESNRVRQVIIRTLKDNIGSNLFAVIHAGGTLFPVGGKNSWSDIDLLVVVEKLDLGTKQRIASAVSTLNKVIGCKVGINVITKQEFQNPVLPVASLDGKTLQALLDLRAFPERLIYSGKPIGKFHSPGKREIRQYSIANFFMFLLRNRKTLSSQNDTHVEELKDTVAKEIRASFIMTKLAIQYFTHHNCRDKKEIIQQAETVFPDFDFKVLKANYRLIQQWSAINDYKRLNIALKSTDAFIETFSRYVSEKIIQ